MGLFGAIKKSWSKAGPQTYLEAILKDAYNMDLLVGGSPLRLAVTLMDGLYKINPDFLNKNLHPKPPRHEVVAVMALLNGIWELGPDSHIHEPLLATLEMMLGQTSRNLPLTTLTILEVDLLGHAFDYLIEVHEPRSVDDADALRQSKELYLAGYAG
jgi:hypothetical protein